MIARQVELQREASDRGWHKTSAWAHTCQVWVERHASLLERISV
jgi:hypothetical protein